ncbi:MAG TPA: hypothetical protein VMW66_06190 [Elusimicrobiales bacterium]|nr:hypothetical protein [Elusimicrobiales bacterium]
MTNNFFIKIENDLIVEKIKSPENEIANWEKLPSPLPADLAQELSDFENGTGDYAPNYAQKRQQSIAKGGYGTWQEQMEILNEQGLEAFQTHCAAVKARFPK